MEFKIYKAKNVNDAITEALIDLEITSDLIEYEVIEEGSAGLLGLFSKEAVIKARRKEEVLEEEEDLSDIMPQFKAGSLLSPQKPKQAKKTGKQSGSEEKSGSKPERSGSRPEKAAGKSEKAGSKSEKAAMKALAEKSNAPAAEKDIFENKDAKGSKDGKESKDCKDNKEPKDRESKPVNKAAAREQQRKASADQNGAESGEKLVTEDEPFNNKDVNDILQVIFAKLEINASVTTTINRGERVINVIVDGDDTGEIIGKRGQTLDAIQYLLSIVINKEQESYYRVKLDTNNYRERRQKTLENLAKNVASKVKKTRKIVVLEPMNPYERRVIHSYLQADKYVTTKSEGVEPNRRVVVYYKKS